VTAALDRYRDERRSQMQAAVTRAMRELDKSGQPINISRVAAAAGVSRQWLYDSPFRAEIERLRERHVGTSSRRPPAKQTSSEASLRAQNEALRQRLKEMRKESAALRDALERALGRLRELDQPSNHG
jgi:outer membrane murein-binding lipoprotein Lpp